MKVVILEAGEEKFHPFPSLKKYPFVQSCCRLEMDVSITAELSGIFWKGPESVSRVGKERGLIIHRGLALGGLNRIGVETAHVCWG